MRTRSGYWKGGTVSVFGYGGGIIPRFSEVADAESRLQGVPYAAHNQPPAGYHYSTDVLRKLCDIWEEHGSGLIAFHGQTGDIMFQGCTTENAQKAFDALNEIGFDLGGAGRRCAPRRAASAHARCENVLLRRGQGASAW